MELMVEPGKATTYTFKLEAAISLINLDSDRTYDARRVWQDSLAEGVSCEFRAADAAPRFQARAEVFDYIERF